MKSIVLPALLAIVLAVTGWVVWSMGKAEQQLADAHKQLVMLHYADAGAGSEDSAANPPLVQRIAGIGRDELVDARHLKATADYWQSAYAALEPKRDAGGSIAETDPALLLHAANASFRASQSDSDRNSALRKLDSVVKNYAEVVKNGPSDVDAAYNYEYAIRVRDALAKARSAPPARLAKATPNGESDLPEGATLHGHPGGPPAKTDMAQFKIVIPKRGEERKDDPQAGKGGTKIRKG